MTPVQTFFEPQPGAWTWPSTAGRRAVVGTGHQAWLWHPGILAKDIAAVLFARRHDADAFHLVVDHDPVEAFRLDLPLRDGGRLSAVSLTICPVNPDLPPCSQPALPRTRLEQGLREIKVRFGRRIACGLDVLESALSGAEVAPTLGEQMVTLTAALMRPYVGTIPMRLSSHIGSEERFLSLVDHMLRDARACVGHYNRATMTHPEARVAPLIDMIDRVELPLWAMAAGEPRRRVFADFSDRVPLLTLENGDVVTPGGGSYALAPRALLMTAYLRSGVCDLFIHGKGGGHYDRITEQWWRAWQGVDLSPMAVVSADVRMSWDVAVAGRGEVDRATWRLHHLPHNVDRALNGEMSGADSAVVARKREVLALLASGTDPARRAGLFKELHAINHGLAASHAALLNDAERELDQAMAGVANRAVAQRRDWCLALYPQTMLRDLQARIASALPSVSPIASDSSTPSGSSR